MSRRRSIGSSELWTQVWSDCFAPDGYMVWSDRSGDVRIPCVTKHVREAGVELTQLHSATNYHSPRFDSTDGVEVRPEHVAGLLGSTGASSLRLDYLAPDAALLEAVRASSLPHRLEVSARSPQIDCTTSFEHWWDGRDSHRKTWARKERRLMLREGAQFQVLDEHDQVMGCLEEVFAVEASGWKGRSGSAIADSDATEQFYTELASLLSREGVLRLFTLRHHGSLAAFQFNTLYDGVMDMLKIGFADQHAKLSPGQVLQIQILRWAFEHPDLEVFDMLGGSANPDQTKARFATHYETLVRARVFAAGPAGLWTMGRRVAGPWIKREVLSPVRRSLRRIPELVADSPRRT